MHREVVVGNMARHEWNLQPATRWREHIPLLNWLVPNQQLAIETRCGNGQSLTGGDKIGMARHHTGGSAFQFRNVQR